MLEKKWTEKNLTPSLDFDEYTISANEDMLKHVWMNLIDNAIKFSNPGSELMISSSEKNGELAVSVANYGVEISKSDYDAIFGKFFQCDKSRASEGNGIGLSIVKHIVNLHSGKITVESKNGKTMFTVVLPKA